MGSDHKGPKDPSDPGASKQGTDSQLCVRASGTSQWMDWRGEKEGQRVPGGAWWCPVGPTCVLRGGSLAPPSFMLL